MTDEKKKPEEEDEVSDEQLDDVAGGLTSLRGQPLSEPLNPVQGTGAGVFSKARTLPAGTSGVGGEPEAVMGDLSALGRSKDDDSV